MAVTCATFLAAVVAAVHLRHQGTTLRYALAGAACAIAVGTLHTGVLTLVTFFVAHFARRTYKSKWLEPRLFLALLFVALSLPVFYPFLFFPAAQESADSATRKSRPIAGQTFQYVFYLDFDGSHESEPCARALAHLREMTPDLRVLGSYPRDENW